MTWPAILVLSAGAYVLKVIGLLFAGPRAASAASGRALRLIALLPPALLGALIVVETFAGDRSLGVDARAAGVAVGAVAAWRNAPFLVVVVVAAAATAAIRAIS